jgi:chromate transporter
MRFIIKEMKKLSILFFEFFRLGLITFGGGIAMLPVIKRMAIKRHFIQENDWEEIVTLSQLSPGAIAVNCANLIGYRTHRYLGSLIAIFGMILPPVIVITILALGFEFILEESIMQSALRGMFVVVFILFVQALFSLGKLAWKKVWMIPISLFAFIMVYFNVLTPGLMLLSTLLIVLLFTFIQQRKKS